MSDLDKTITAFQERHIGSLHRTIERLRELLAERDAELSIWRGAFPHLGYAPANGKHGGLLVEKSL